MRPIVVFAFLCFLSSPAEARRVEECGVEGYVTRADPACGTLWREARTQTCGVESWHSGASMECPGSIPAKTSSHREPCASPKCPTGFILQNVQEISHDSPGRACYRQVFWDCFRPAQPASCEKSEFGPASFNSCRDPSHGFEAYETCTRPEFGVIYRDCAILKTRAEIANFMTNLQGNIDLFGLLYLQNVSLSLKLQQSTTGLACFIRKWENDPLAANMTEELKGEFAILSGGLAYDASLAHACEEQNMADLPCASNDNSLQCKAQRARLAGKAWLEENLKTTTILLGDVVAQQDSGVAAELGNLQANLAAFLQ